MASSSRPAPERYIDMREFKWSPTEKAVARKAFDRALRQELDKVMREAKEKAERVKEPADLWRLEEYLTKRRHDIDNRFDYRYSVLPLVFANLIREGLLAEEDLQGLSEEKLTRIRVGARM
jgi:Photoprotection regulator fluorescence recovery protein